MPGAGVARGDEGEGAAVAVGFGREFCGEVGGDALDVLHQRGRVAEDVMVDALDEITRTFAGGLKGYAVGVVDVAVPVGTAEANSPGMSKARAIARRSGVGSLTTSAPDSSRRR